MWGDEFGLWAKRAQGLSHATITNYRGRCRHVEARLGLTASGW